MVKYEEETPSEAIMRLNELFVTPDHIKKLQDDFSSSSLFFCLLPINPSSESKQTQSGTGGSVSPRERRLSELLVLLCIDT